MDLISAIKSGKRFKRPAMFKWLTAGNIVCFENGVPFDAVVEDLCATDYEVETVKKELSAQDILQALKTVQVRRHRRIIDHPMRDSLELDTVAELLKELGL